jgi:RNA polymerase sigma-70 factor (ECF subfamily)
VGWEGRAALPTFAHRITVRVAYKCFRKRRLDAPIDLVREPVDGADPESRVSAREALRRLYRCLDKLPPKRRVAFALCAIEGLTPADAAELAGTLPGTMRARLMHARSEVERMLKHDPYLAGLLDPGAGGDA